MNDEAPAPPPRTRKPAISPTPRRHNPFLELAEELALAACIVIGHGLLVLVIIGAIWVTGWALEHSQHGDHAATVYGVSVQFLIEGGEVILVGIVLVLGIVSAFLTLVLGLIRRLKG